MADENVFDCVSLVPRVAGECPGAVRVDVPHVADDQPLADDVQFVLLRGLARSGDYTAFDLFDSSQAVPMGDLNFISFNRHAVKMKTHLENVSNECQNVEVE